MHKHTLEFFSAAAHKASQITRQTIECTGVEEWRKTLAAARFKLNNGLTILLLPFAKSSVFTYQTWFKVGSKHEEPHRTGLAHLFEHLMFKGTKNHAPGVFDKEMERRGAQTNAATWVDWTYYTESLASRSDNLKQVMAFEADRMVNLILDEQTFRSELEVVKNERRMTVDNSVSGLLAEKLCELAFTVHPYRFTTIGLMEHLEATTIPDLERFYKTYYAPNNATVVLTGAFDVEEALVDIARFYGDLLPQTIPIFQVTQEPEQQQQKRAEIKTPTVATQFVSAYKAPPQHHPDFAALEVLADTLASGDTARLYQRLVVEEELLTEIGCFATPYAEPGLFEIFGTLQQDVEIKDVEACIAEELQTLTQGITQEELLKAQNTLELSQLEQFNQTEGAAETLGHFQTNFNDFSMAFKHVERFQHVTLEQLKNVAAKTFVNNKNNWVIADV